MDQNEYISILKSDDHTSYGKVYDAYSGALYGVILRMVRDESVASELLQDAFLKIWINRERYDPGKGRLYTWMNRIAKNLALNYLDSKAFKNQSKIQEIDKSVFTVVEPRGLLVDTLDMKSKLMLLKDKHRNVLDLAYFQGYTQQEISDELSMPLGSVKSCIKIAIRDLRKIYFEKIEVYSKATISFLITIFFM